VRIKYPWRLQIGDHSWIGEDAWIDNLADVTIGANVCVSQGVYLCTGSHDRDKPTFDLVTQPITLKDGSWICTRATVLGNVTVHEGAVVAAGSVVHVDVAANSIVGGVPARPVGT
jgi:putative colanic acid biosynthesis acetyltransferase WcaF